MIGLLCFALAVLASSFKSKLRLEAENAVLRHQLIVLRRRLHGRVRLTNHDRWFFIQLYRWVPSILQVLTIIRPETLVGWHRAGFRCYWRWKSRPLGGRLQIDTELRVLIRRMSMENPLWGAPRIHGELLKLGFEIAQSSIAKYMVKRRGPPSQGWRTFLRNHAPDIPAMDLGEPPETELRSTRDSEGTSTSDYLALNPKGRVPALTGISGKAGCQSAGPKGTPATPIHSRRALPICSRCSIGLRHYPHVVPERIREQD
jgi:hypothetical protein